MQEKKKKKIQVRQQENLPNDKDNADCGEAAEFPPFEISENRLDK